MEWSEQEREREREREPELAKRPKVAREIQNPRIENLETLSNQGQNLANWPASQRTAPIGIGPEEDDDDEVFWITHSHTMDLTAMYGLCVECRVYGWF